MTTDAYILLSSYTQSDGCWLTGRCLVGNVTLDERNRLDLGRPPRVRPLARLVGACAAARLWRLRTHGGRG